MRANRRADARSKETTYSGLPKAVRLTNTAGQAAPVNATFTSMLFDKAAYNYGGYTFTFTGALMNQVAVPEPGLYDIEGQIGFQVNAETASADIWINNAVAAPDGSANRFATGAALGAGTAFAPQQVSTRLELKQGDLIGLVQLQVTGPFATAAQYTWLNINKLGGQY